MAKFIKKITLKNGTITQLMGQTNQQNGSLDSVMSDEARKKYTEDLKNLLLECDYRRAMLDRYDDNLLLDPNRGHWDLWDWSEEGEDTGEIILAEGFMARDPADDINHGIVGIDFGTKSTVVVYENEHMEILPLQVGSGTYSEGVQQKNYENPTVLQFIDLEAFTKAYGEREGRPFTNWRDVTVSHTAFENLSHSSSEQYYSFFDNLKQWCGSGSLRVKLRDDKGHLQELPAFIDLVEGEFDPLEIYAYYLGAYINNMLQEKHIFLQYILSFPVTYERGIREKMRRSFAVGLKKSLPTALLSNEMAMKQFVVQEGASEPAAYAITALEEYGFEPEGEEEAYYAVFDFGGGTADFDFGVFREAEEDRYDYTLLHFGANGDRTLGGENLLRLLAFEVCKANRDKLLKPGGTGNTKIPFTWPAEKHDFPGSEGLIKDSQEAHANMRTLMEALRPLWERPDSEEARKLLDDGVIMVSMFDDAGQVVKDVSLQISGNAGDSQSDTAGAVAALQLNLEELLRQRIDKGIRNFFISLQEAFHKGITDETYHIKSLEDVSEICVFLAGNSSKSKLVKSIFKEYTGKNGSVKELLGIEEGKEAPNFTLYPALGTEEAYALQEERGITPRKDDLAAPTGKTGVAFGLLQCRESGNVRVIDINPDGAKVPFQYYVGRNKKRKFKTIIDRNTKMNQWYAFIDAGASFDLLYTDVPLAATNTAPVTIARQIHITVEKPDTEATVYIRPVGPRSIEYMAVRNKEELDNPTNTDNVEPKRLDLT